MNKEGTAKTLSNTTASQAKDNVEDIIFWGDGDTFKLISKASSANEGWVKSTKAMEIEGVGCVVQVTTQQNNQVAEALTFVPGVRIEEELVLGKVASRKLVAIKPASIPLTGEQIAKQREYDKTRTTEINDLVRQRTEANRPTL